MLSIIICSFLFLFNVVNSQESGVVIELFHAFPSLPPIQRGIFTINNKNEIKQVLSESSKNGIYDQDSLNEFKKLLSNNDLYRIHVRTTTNSTSSEFITSAIPSVSLLFIVLFIYSTLITI